VWERTQALTQEMAERERLEKEIIEISEREQRRIGRDLHDSLCQHLTGTALACQVLAGRLAAQSLPEAVDAGKLAELVEDGIALARSLARGIHPAQIEAEGLMGACRELAASVTDRARITCRFESNPPVLVDDATTATHLYRIAQEAVTNALRHGKPSQILISLMEREGRVTLSVEDDGVGLPEVWQKGQGLGTRIMAHRASMIGGVLAIEPGPTGGTVVSCSLSCPPNSGSEASGKPITRGDQVEALQA
jgi:signal transduction histidine kinase